MVRMVLTRSRHACAVVCLAVLAALLMVPSNAAAAPTGRSSHQLNHGGLERQYQLFVPRSRPGAAPLVVVLHGGYGSARQAQRAYGWDSQAQRRGFVVAYPDGFRRSWNAGTCCGPAQQRNVDDVGFIRAVVADVSKRTSIDPRRIYVTGMSNGAMMTYRLACQTNLFAAVAVVAGTIVSRCSSPAPTSVLHIHGDADPRVPYRGGPGLPFGGGGARVNGLSVAADNALWRNADRCAPPRIGRSGRLTISTARCRAGRTVELITVAGGGHEWPGSRSASQPAALDATAAIADFFGLGVR
ncbi:MULTISPECIES: PHB depolymerase family esterase [unclassified Gordonia (in: high G+C Gram-positive bacteria)]|uniref:extracellular catalytic domain type 1 short-chain-length polyhydroxyalkanoate depolymerase n=1 Tax=unclassified Gordonia (in: high G+C Gram-positive bacteria) TaxID=2657482 RepID=UPI001F0F2FE8|nr:PHB depolymerase family esterase [Gordonia sp. ABSL49_1]MCH5644779.1 prolyl oligopeptidase family serine peptidase [Gordonia sp. ABSL49_1]